MENLKILTYLNKLKSFETDEIYDDLTLEEYIELLFLTQVYFNLFKKSYQQIQFQFIFFCY